MKKKTAAPESYESAFTELRLILDALQEGKVSMDELSAKVLRAQELVEYCREKLRQTEADIEQLNPSTES